MDSSNGLAVKKNHRLFSFSHRLKKKVVFIILVSKGHSQFNMFLGMHSTIVRVR